MKNAFYEISLQHTATLPRLQNLSWCRFCMHTRWLDVPTTATSGCLNKTTPRCYWRLYQRLERLYSPLNLWDFFTTLSSDSPVPSWAFATSRIYWCLLRLYHSNRYQQCLTYRQFPLPHIQVQSACSSRDIRHHIDLFPSAYSFMNKPSNNPLFSFQTFCFTKAYNFCHLWLLDGPMRRELE